MGQLTARLERLEALAAPPQRPDYAEAHARVEAQIERIARHMAAHPTPVEQQSVAQRAVSAALAVSDGPDDPAFWRILGQELRPWVS